MVLVVVFPSLFGKVVLRALLVCHILLDEGSKGFVDLLLHSAVTFNLPYLRDQVSEYAQYTRAFARYIQEKIITVRTLVRKQERERDTRLTSGKTQGYELRHYTRSL